MMKIKLVWLIITVGCFIPSFLAAQTHDIGAIGALSLSKDFGRYWSVKLEQEFRINQNLSVFDRSLTSIGVDYVIVKKRLKAEIDYDFISQRQSEYFEIRKRSSAALETGFSIRSFDFTFKTRGQVLWRDEDRGDYKFNPKYVLRNKLECVYKIFGSSIKPFVSAEVFCPLNGLNGFYMDGFRAVFGAKYRISLHHSVSFYLRYDQEIQQVNPKSVFYTGVGWNYKL